ncbi:pyridoxal phosphate-dependent transferase [Camillea tinctor]|nr:pyridoxal phosphate-dependent transferase [Camillea tinctor]
MTVRFEPDLEPGEERRPEGSRPDSPTLSQQRLSDKFSTYRHLVPLLSQEGLTFLNAASAPPSNLIVHEAILRYASEALYEAHPQTTWFAREREARSLLARCINAPDPSSVIFTRDTTEGMGSFIRSLRLAPGDNVVILDNEYPNQAYGWLALRRDIPGLEVRQIPLAARSAAADAHTFLPYVDARTRAVGLSSIMFDTGQRNDVAGICAALRPRGVHVLVDLAQHVGFALFDVVGSGVSAAAFTLHKGLNCPTGIAGLYVDPAFVAEFDPTPPIVSVSGVRDAPADHLVPDAPVVFHPDARRFQHQNLSLVGAAAANAFLRFYLDTMGPRDVEEHLYSLGDVLIAECDRLGVGVASPRDRDKRAPHLYVLDLRDPRWVARLDSHGVKMTPNRVGIRVSFGFYSNLDDVKSLVRELASGIEDGLPLHA